MSRRCGHEPWRNADFIRKENICINPDVCVVKWRQRLPSRPSAGWNYRPDVIVEQRSPRLGVGFYSASKLPKSVALINGAAPHQQGKYMQFECRFKCERQMLASCFTCTWMISCARCRLPVVTFATLWIYVSLVHRCAPLNICRISRRFWELFRASLPNSSRPSAVQPCSHPCEMQQVGRPGRYLMTECNRYEAPC